jgi:hypothetical protein
LHFSKDSNLNVTWCAEMYPTQNGNVSKLDNIAGTPGLVVPYTSHTVKNSTSPACIARAPAGLLPGYTGPALHGGAAQPPNLGLDGTPATTCDRTIAASMDPFPRVPLTESPTQLESSLTADPSYGCTITWDNGGTKNGSATPAGGCCGPSVGMQTGVGGAANAHLEPVSDATTNTTCMTPNY